MDAGALTAYATWLQDDGVRYGELADPADPARADWRVLMVCVTDDGEQMLFVPPDQYDELAEADISGCTLGA